MGFASYFVITIILIRIGIRTLLKYLFSMSSSSFDTHLMPLPANIEDDGALADLVGDDEEGGWRVDWSLR